MLSTIPTHADLRASDTRQGRPLEYFTLGWNLTEAVVGIGAGVIAGSIALVAFGVDSIIESFSGAALLWRLQRHKADEKREQLALKLVGISFFVLAAYVAADAVKNTYSARATACEYRRCLPCCRLDYCHAASRSRKTSCSGAIK